MPKKRSYFFIILFILLFSQIKIYAQEAKKLWSYNFTSEIASQPVYYDQKLYFTTLDGYAYCLDGNGNQVWKNKTDGPISASPYIRNKILYIGNQNGTFQAIDADYGFLRWKKSLNEKIDKQASFYEGNVYINTALQTAFSFNAISGQKNWKRLTNGRILSSPKILNGLLFIPSEEGMLLVVDAKHGPVKWSKDMTFTDNGSPLTFFNEKIIIVSKNNKIISLNSLNKNISWQTIVPAKPISQILLHSGKLIFTDYSNSITAISANTGTLLWRQKFSTIIKDAPLSIGQYILGCSNDGNLFVLSPSTGKQLLTINLGKNVSSQPLLVENKYLLVPSAGSLTCYQLIIPEIKSTTINKAVKKTSPKKPTKQK